MKKIFTFAFLFTIIACGSAFASGYNIDSVIDNNTGDDWLEDTPTLLPSTDYTITINGSGVDIFCVPEFGCGPGDDLEDQVALGAFIDFNGTRANDQWDTFLEPAVVSDSAAGVPFLFFSDYSVTGTFTTPDTFGASQGSGFAFLRGDETEDPTAGTAQDDSLARAFFDVNLGEQAIPEPATMTLLGLGLAGGLVSFRKKSA